MTFGLAPGKLGFKLGEVLVGLQSGTTDVPETISSTQNKLHTLGYSWNSDTLAYEQQEHSDVVPLGTQLVSGDRGQVCNTVIHGLTTAGGGSYVDVKVAPSGALTTSATLEASTADVGRVGFSLDAVSPFGDLVTAPITPLVQMDFIYGINTQTGVKTELNGATVDTNGGRLRLQTSTATNGSAIFSSKRPARYRPGQGIIARFTPVFAAGAADSKQICGPGSSADGYFFGYNGTSFGICYRNAGSDQWLSRAVDWNGDKCDGTGASGFNWNPANGNVCQVRYPFLGYGDITFWVQDTDTARWILCHTIKYTNTTATIQLGNPSLYFYQQVINSGNATNLINYCGSVGFFLRGERQFISSPRWAMDNNKPGITTETCLLNLKNATTYNGVSNRALLRLTQVSFAASAASGISVLRFKINATIGGAPAYATINGTTADGGVTITSGNSVVSYDTAGTTVAGGTYIFNASVGNGGGGVTIDLTPYNLFVAPGDILTVSGFSTISSAMSVSINWNEDI